MANLQESSPNFDDFGAIILYLGLLIRRITCPLKGQLNQLSEHVPRVCLTLLTTSSCRIRQRRSALSGVLIAELNCAVQSVDISESACHCQQDVATRTILYGMAQQGLSSHATHYRSFRRRFYGSDDPTNSVVALKDDGQSTRSRADPTRLSSLKGKEKNVSKRCNICIVP